MTPPSRMSPPSHVAVPPTSSRCPLSPQAKRTTATWSGSGCTRGRRSAAPPVAPTTSWCPTSCPTEGGQGGAGCHCVPPPRPLSEGGQGGRGVSPQQHVPTGQHCRRPPPPLCVCVLPIKSLCWRHGLCLCWGGGGAPMGAEGYVWHPWVQGGRGAPMGSGRDNHGCWEGGEAPMGTRSVGGGGYLWGRAPPAFIGGAEFCPPVVGGVLSQGFPAWWVWPHPWAQAPPRRAQGEVGGDGWLQPSIQRCLQGPSVPRRV